MSAHPASHQRGWLSALVAQVSEFVLEPVEAVVDAEPAELEPYPVIAIVSAGRKSGASTVARLLAAEFATRMDGTAVVATTTSPRRAAPPSRAAIRLATALGGAVDARPLGRLCVAADASAGAAPVTFEAVANAARYLAPVVLDLPADGSGPAAAAAADRVAVVGSASAEPALLGAVALLVGGEPLVVVNRSPVDLAYQDRFGVPESRLAARAANLGARAIGAAGSAIADLADALELEP